MLNCLESTKRDPAKLCYHQLTAADLLLSQKGTNLYDTQIFSVGEQTNRPIHHMQAFLGYGTQNHSLTILPGQYSSTPEILQDCLAPPSIANCALISSRHPRREETSCKFLWNTYWTEVIIMTQIVASILQKLQRLCWSLKRYVSGEYFVPTSSYLNPRISGTPFQFRLTSICVIRPEQRSNKRLKGQDGKPLPRLKRGFGLLSACGPSGSLHDMYIRAGVSLRLESITSHHQQHTGHPKLGCLVQLVTTQPKTYHSA